MELDPGEVFSLINYFKNKSTRDTKISALKVANTSYNFTKTLAVIINKSFQEGIFPDQMKLAKVVPIHKGGAKTDAGNYRPISLLNTFSKIYAKLMHRRILNFWNIMIRYTKTSMDFGVGDHANMPCLMLRIRYWIR